MKRGEYMAKRKEIQEECAKKLQILDDAFELFGGTPVGKKGGGTSGPQWTHPLSKRDAVRSAVKKVVGNFSLKDVKTVVETDYGKGIADNQLSAILSKLAEKGEIELLKKKVGKSPAIYRHKAQLQMAAR